MYKSSIFSTPWPIFVISCIDNSWWLWTIVGQGFSPSFNVYFLLLSYISSLYNLYINPLSYIQCTDIFSLSIGWLFIFWLPSQNSPHRLGLHLGFKTSYLDPKVLTVALLSVGGCQIIVAMGWDTNGETPVSLSRWYTFW